MMMMMKRKTEIWRKTRGKFNIHISTKQQKHFNVKIENKKE